MHEAVWLRQAARALLVLLALAGIARADASGSEGAGLRRNLDQETHNVGALHLRLTNYGLIGSGPEDWPSARWPGASGADHLYQAGLWIGARVAGVPRVSTGGLGSEFVPSWNSQDVITTATEGEPGGLRYPDPGGDDDGDGLEDEDPNNNFDDDGDGAVDEDYAAIGAQHLRLANGDDAEVGGHFPLGLEVVQQSFQWTGEHTDDFIGFEWEIRHTGSIFLQEVYLGFHADFDVWEPGQINEHEDDRVGWFAGNAAASDGSVWPLEIAYAFDGEYAVPTGYIGLLLLDHTVDEGGLSAPEEVGVSSFQVYRGLGTFPNGGPPTTDAERYSLLAADQLDYPPSIRNDYQVLIASGPFSLPSGSTLRYCVAMVAGANLAGLKANAAEAMRLYRGVRFDRDGNPATGPGGRECLVNWLDPADYTPTLLEYFRAEPEFGQVTLRWQVSAEEPVGFKLLAESDSWEWEVANVEGGAGEYWAADRSPRLAEAAVVDYRLLARSPSEGWQQLGQQRVQLPQLPESPAITAVYPNPCRPAANIVFTTPRRQQLRLAIYDIRGRQIALLADGVFEAGSHVVAWDGKDSAKREVASGVYLSRLAAAQHEEVRKLVVQR